MRFIKEDIKNMSLYRLHGFVTFYKVKKIKTKDYCFMDYYLWYHDSCSF